MFESLKNQNLCLSKCCRKGLPIYYLTLIECIQSKLLVGRGGGLVAGRSGVEELGARVPIFLCKGHNGERGKLCYLLVMVEHNQIL